MYIIVKRICVLLYEPSFQGLSLELPAQSFAVFEYSLTVKSQSSDPLGLFMIETDFEQM